MVRQLGPEGLTAVRVFGDDVAEVMIKEGPESLNVLRKTGGAGGRSSPTRSCRTRRNWPRRVLAAFLANPDKFVDYAGQATEFAVREFAKAGVTLAAAAGSGAAQGLEASIGQVLADYGLDPRVPLPGHGAGQAGRRRRVAGDRGDARPLRALALGLADRLFVGTPQADIIRAPLHRDPRGTRNQGVSPHNGRWAELYVWTPWRPG